MVTTCFIIHDSVTNLILYALLCQTNTGENKKKESTRNGCTLTITLIWWKKSHSTSNTHKGILLFSSTADHLISWPSLRISRWQASDQHNLSTCRAHEWKKCWMCCFHLQHWQIQDSRCYCPLTFDKGIVIAVHSCKISSNNMGPPFKMYESFTSSFSPSHFPFFITCIIVIYIALAPYIKGVSLW